MVAQKLELPDVLVDAIAFHHNYAHLKEFMEHEAMAGGVYVASLFPHVMTAWNHRKAEELCRFLDEDAKPKGIDTSAFLTAVQKEFDQLHQFFEPGAEAQNRLAELMQVAAREAADNTTHLVGAVQQLMQQAARAGVEMHQLAVAQDKLEEKATRDQLTGVLNREGFTTEAAELLAKATRYGAGFAVAYLDVDRFKRVNDTLGHDLGDLALKRTAGQMKSLVGQADLVGRMGGDEFALLLYDCTEEQAGQRVQEVLSGVAAQPVGRGQRSAKVTLSAGCLWVRPSGQPCSLETLLNMADKLLYKAKDAGGDCVRTRSVRA
jgi:diguanylate cyclase (GGDEF)-like protein